MSREVAESAIKPAQEEEVTLCPSDRCRPSPFPVTAQSNLRLPVVSVAISISVVVVFTASPVGDAGEHTACCLDGPAEACAGGIAGKVGLRIRLVLDRGDHAGGV